MARMELTEEPSTLSDAVTAMPALAPKDLLAVARGFSRITWSIPLGLFLFTRAMDFAVSLYFRLPSYIIAVGLCYWGLIALRQVNPISHAWQRHLRIAFLLVFLLLYFSPFVYWWTLHPHGNHFVVNLFGMLLSATWLMWTINNLAGEVALALEDRMFLIESKLCGWAVLVLMAAPLLLYFAYASFHASREEIALYLVIQDLRFLPYAQWIFALLILPITLTLAIAWKTKEQAFASLRKRAESADPRESVAD